MIYLGLLFICTVNQLCCIWLSMSREYSPTHLRIHLVTSVRSHIINKHSWSHSVLTWATRHAHVITLPPPCLRHEMVRFTLWAAAFLQHTFIVPWYKFILDSLPWIHLSKESDSKHRRLLDVLSSLPVQGVPLPFAHCPKRVGIGSSTPLWPSTGLRWSW